MTRVSFVFLVEIKFNKHIHQTMRKFFKIQKITITITIENYFCFSIKFEIISMIDSFKILHFFLVINYSWKFDPLGGDILP